MLPLPVQHHHINNLQMHWRSDALRDAEYNLNRAHEEFLAGNNVLGHAYMDEYRWDINAAKKRLSIANYNRKF